MSKEKKLLLTGFGPFGDLKTNTSWDLATLLDGRRYGDVVVVAHRVEPVAFEESATIVKRLLRKVHPRAALALGVAKTRRLRLERFAHNLRDSAATDTAGVRIGDERLIDPDEPQALRTALPLNELRKALADKGFSVEISNDAGGFVCNDVYFTLLQWQQRSGLPAGFVHVPNMERPDGGRRADVSFDRMARALDTLLATIATHVTPEEQTDE